MNTFSVQRRRPAESHPLRAGERVSEKLPAAADVAPEPMLVEVACNGCVSP
jgi:hypothetical protein